MKMPGLIAVLLTTSVCELVSASALLKRGSLEVPVLPQSEDIGLLEQHATIAETPLTDVIWPEESSLPLPIQYLLASTWVLMLGMIPLLLPIIEQKPPTRTQMAIGAGSMLVVFGGFFLFTNVLLFQSIHFKQIRPLTIVECIYFMAQVITTVGYGDITPAKPRGQVFVGLYVLGALFIIAMLISDLTNHMAKMAEEYKEKECREANAASASARDRDEPLRLMFKPQRPSVKPLVSAFGAFAMLQVCWIIFFSTYPGEGKNLFQASYMSIITLSTVGFGWFTPVTEAGMIFGAFWMLLGAGALVDVIGEFTSLMVKFHEYEHLLAGGKAEALKTLTDVTGGSEQVTEMQFLHFGLLQMKCVSPEEIESILQAWVTLQPKRGVVGVGQIEDVLHREKEMVDKGK